MSEIDLSDREVRQKFLQCNYSLLAAYAIYHQKKSGRGIVVIESYHADGSITIAYETELKNLFSEKTIKQKINDKVKLYHPDKEVLVGFQIDRNPQINTDNCILHSLGSTTFPVNTAAEIFNDIMEQFQNAPAATAA